MKLKWFSKYIIAIALSVSPGLSAEPSVLQAHWAKFENKPIREIRFQGLKRTRPSSLRKEVLIQESEQLNLELFEESLQRLKTFMAFRDVQANLIEGPEDGVIVEFVFEEGWTILPMFRVGGAGMTTFVTAGVNDLNLLGDLGEAALQLGTLGGAPIGVASLLLPHFPLDRSTLYTELWGFRRIRPLYDDNVAPSGGFTLKRIRANTHAEWEFVRRWYVAAGLEYNQDRLTEDYLEPRFIQANRDHGFVGSQHDGRALLPRIGFGYGRINWERSRNHGFMARLYYERAIPVADRWLEFDRVLGEVKYFALLPWQGNLGLRAAGGHTNSSAIQQGFFMGGLENVRGYIDGQFVGKTYWQANAELRVPSWSNQWVLFQHVLFYDAGGVGDFFSGSMDPFSAMGIGLRFLSPRAKRLALRLDIAFPLDPRGEKQFSFGTRQFF